MSEEGHDGKTEKEPMVDVLFIRRCMYKRFNLPGCEGDVEVTTVKRTASQARKILAQREPAIVSHLVCNGCLAAGRKGEAIS